MMATTQCQREKTGSWTAIFPNETVTEQQSILFVKKLLAVAVSNIAYLRALFPEHAFGDRCLEDLHLKILRDESSCPGACQVIKYIKGCFDALDKKYLYLDPDNPETVIESYTFKFSYANDGGIDIYRNDKKISSANTAAETKKATIRLLRTIVVLTQTMNAVPEDTMLTMKLLYYDEVTPSDYEPPGFKPASCSTFKFEEEPMTIKVGDVATVNVVASRMKLRVKTNKNLFDTKECPLEEEQEMQDQKMEDDIEKISGEVVQEDSSPGMVIPTESPAVPGSDGSAIEIKDSQLSQMTETQEEEFGVRCPCGCHEDDGLMILCAVCSFWQHGFCFCIKEENEAPDRHVCNLCGDVDEADKWPTDSYLCGLSPAAVQATCLWRRALMASLEASRVVGPSLAKRLGVELKVAQGLIDRLEKEGYIKCSGKGKRLGKTVDRDKVVNDGMKKYMTRNQPRSSTEKTPCGQSENNGTEKQIEKITAMTESIEIKETQKKKHSKMDLLKRKKEVRKSPRLEVQKTENDTDSQMKRKSRKRAYSKMDENLEFEIADSQDLTCEDEDGRRKNKASDVARAIMV